MRPTWLYSGLAALAVGFLALAFTWGRVAAETSVALQVPYVLSGGGAAIVAVMVGLRLLEVDALRRDAGRRLGQLDELASLLEELRVSLAGADQTAAEPGEHDGDGPGPDPDRELDEADQS